ncbi:MAG: GtrA family protein [Rhizobiaceae bacterium]
MLKDEQHRRRFIRYVILGCSNAVIGYAVFASLYSSELIPLYMRAELSQVASYGTGMLWAFFWSRNWAFRDGWIQHTSLSTQAFRFMLVQAWSLIFSVFLVSITINTLNWSSLPGWLSAMSVVTIVHYLAMSSWVFPMKSGSH